jgi:hypothetical protein
VDRSAYPLRALHPHRTVRTHGVGPYLDAIPRIWVELALLGSRPSYHFISATQHPLYIPLCPLLHYLSSFRSTVAAAYHALPLIDLSLYSSHTLQPAPLSIFQASIFPPPFSLFYIGRSSLTPPTLVKVVICFILTMVWHVLSPDNYKHLKSVGAERTEMAAALAVHVCVNVSLCSGR